MDEERGKSLIPYGRKGSIYFGETAVSLIRYFTFSRKEARFGGKTKKRTFIKGGGAQSFILKKGEKFLTRGERKKLTQEGPCRKKANPGAC